MKEAAILAFKNARHIKSSTQAGCYYCGNIFPSQEIKEYTDQGETALCPKCCVDAVLCDSQQIAINPDNLRAAHMFWFQKNKKKK